MLSLIGIWFFNHSYGQITPWEAAAQMQKGINLGNTLEPPIEAGWNNPAAEEYYFDLYKEAGFETVRIPVRWDEHTSKTFPYTIDSNWLNRVEKILDWGLARDLFIVVNSHHDNWIKENYTNPDIRERFDSIWSQISVRFKDKSEKLIFEVLNEPHGLDKTQNDDMHARIISIIRKTNPTRLIIFQGHDWGGSNELLQAAIPDDNYVIGSFHSYDPYRFGLLGEGTWGSSTDITTLRNKFNGVKSWSDTNGIPVILGEFGSLRICDYNSRMKHYKYYVEFAQDYGFISCAWDDGGDFRIMERETKDWLEVKDILIYSSSNSPRSPKSKLVNDTVIELSWINSVYDNDSIFIERRTEYGRYHKIASLAGDASIYQDINPDEDMYHYYRIISHYNRGEEIYSHPLREFMPVYTIKERGLFLGYPLPIPGIIEAEDFDTGGEGLSYHDMDERNIAGAYRPDEGVDIYDIIGVGFHIGNALPGEWYEYTVNVEEEAEYTASFHIATLVAGGTFSVTIGEIESGILSTQNSFSYLETKAVSTTMNLLAGEQILRFTVIDNPKFNIDKFEFVKNSTDNINNIIANMEFKIYQDQNKNIVIDYEHFSEIKKIQIYNSLGKLIYLNNNPANNPIINLPDLEEGIYILKALSDGKMLSRKLKLY